MTRQRGAEPLPSAAGRTTASADTAADTDGAQLVGLISSLDVVRLVAEAEADKNP